MSTEAALWDLMRSSKLPGSWHRVENRVDPGMPDLHFAWNDGLRFRTGWVELKTMDRAPRHGRIILIDHFRRAQRFWLRSYADNGGFAAMMLRIDSQYLLLPGRWAATHAGIDATMDQLVENASGYWIGKWEKELFVQGLLWAHDHLRSY